NEYFTTLISGEDLPHSKPAPDIYLKTAKMLNIAPSDCVALEDSKNGSIAAKSAGMYCIGFANPNSGNQDLSAANIIVNKITDI
ncbi:HAD-IA family hydrolase, partial [Fusobacterium mortiferum]|nr:HAD-IA family hydrolase [Fusobacterium mortiferum]